MSDFADHIEPLVKKEGGYRLVEIPGDRGGRTFAGISERFNPGWHGWPLIEAGAPAAELVEAVHERYREQYWEPLRLDDIESHDVQTMLFSCAVLSGTKTAVRLAQMAVEAKPIDGIMGPRTLSAINDTLEALFEARFALARINRLREIANRNATQRQFLRGWINRIFEEMDNGI